MGLLAAAAGSPSGRVAAARSRAAGAGGWAAPRQLAPAERLSRAELRAFWYIEMRRVTADELETTPAGL